MSNGIAAQISDAAMESSSVRNSELAMARVSKQENSKVFISFVFFIIAFGILSFVTAQPPANIAALSIGAFALLALYIYLFMKYISPPLEVTLRNNSIVEFQNGKEIGEISFDRITQFGFIKDNRGRVWIRIKPLGGSTFRYVPKGFSKEERERFYRFGNQLQSAITSFNNKAI